jgi:hypothetical protein
VFPFDTGGVTPARPGNEEIARLLHELREPMGAFVIYLALLDDEPLSEDGKRHLDTMLGNVQRMVATIGKIASSFGLEKSTPLAILSADRSAHGA